MNILKTLPSLDGKSYEDILNILLEEEYGYLPEKPKSVKAKIIEVDEGFCSGKTILKRIELTCETRTGRFSFPVNYNYPISDKPVPCFVMINFRDCVPDRALPSEEIADAGYAVMSFCYNDIAIDNSPDFAKGLAGVVYNTGKHEKNQCGKLGLWAWAASRVMDYALTLSEIDKRYISVIGHSRLGKTALLAGAVDHRFYCAFSNASGCSGASIARGATGEKIEDICRLFPYWFCENYFKYINNEEAMPFDQHFLLAANAPHRVYVASASEDYWATPENEYLSCIAASKYFEDMGLKGLVTDKTKADVGDKFHDGYIGYHKRYGHHRLGREDWNCFIEYLDKHIREDKQNEATV